MSARTRVPETPPAAETRAEADAGTFLETPAGRRLFNLVRDIVADEESAEVDEDSESVDEAASRALQRTCCRRQRRLDERWHKRR